MTQYNNDSRYLPQIHTWREAAQQAPPIPESYWIEPGSFAAGEYPGSHNRSTAELRLSMLARAGINNFIDLTEDSDGLSQYDRALREVRYVTGHSAIRERHPLPDRSIPHTTEQMVQILDSIDAALHQNRGVYVHCWGGIGRTGTVVGCWLVRHGLSNEGALEQLADWWQHVPKSQFHPTSPQTETQHAYVLEWREATA